MLDKFKETGTTVSFIGAGNLAWHLAPALDNTDFAVREVFSQNIRNAEALAERLYKAEVKVSLDFSYSTSKIFIIAVSDDAIKDVMSELILPQHAILVHTSGSQPLNALAYASTLNIGVFYPLQTFTKGQKVDFKDIPIFVESENDATERILLKMGKAISRHVKKITFEKRKAIHVAAVFASNFTNHMLHVASDILEENGLDWDVLKPLIAETINKSLAIGPSRAQTGPAKRGDLEILDKHLAFLSDDEKRAEIYKVVSQHILDIYND